MTPRPGRPTGARPVPDPGFAGDTGAADPALAAVLAAHERDECSDADVLAALDGARLIVAMTAVPADPADPAAGTGGHPTGPQPDPDTAVDMALPIMLGVDGRRALPVFTSVESLASWDPASRPVPVASRRAAAGAIQEQCSFLVLDPSGPITWVADRRQVEWLAGVRAAPFG